eukprot:10756-Heterococcus_DN1.PRE.3
MKASCAVVLAVLGSAQAFVPQATPAASTKVRAALIYNYCALHSSELVYAQGRGCNVQQQQ